MNSRANNWAIIGGLAMTLGANALLGGCEKKKPPPPPPPPPPPVAKGPDWTLEDIEMDPRVQFPEARTPSSRELAQAVADLASAIVTGNDAEMMAMLDPIDHAVMSDLVTAGDWKSGTSSIEAVRVCVLEEGDDKGSCRLGLGVQDAMGAYLLAWTGAADSSEWTFQGLSIMPQLADRVATLDGVAMVEPTIDTSAPTIVELSETINVPDANVTSSGGDSGPSNDPPPPPGTKPPG